MDVKKHAKLIGVTVLQLLALLAFVAVCWVITVLWFSL